MEMTSATEDMTPNLATTASNLGTAVSQAAAMAGRKANEVKETIQAKSDEILADTKQTVSEAYDKTSRVVSENYQRTLEFGRNNPGTASLIALGAGIGIGVFLAHSYSSRSQVNREVPPLPNA